MGVMDENDISRRSLAKVIAPALAASAFLKPAIAQEKRVYACDSPKITPMLQLMLDRVCKLACSYILA